MSALAAMKERNLEMQDTDIGLLPADWKVVKATQIGKFRGGNGFPPAYQGRRFGEFPFFKVSDMNNVGNEHTLVAANNYLSQSDLQRLGAYVFPTSTIVFAKVGAAIFLERKRILGQPSCLDNNMAGFQLTDSNVNGSFIHYYLQSIRLGDLVSATALPALSGGILGAINIPLPSPKEQASIAEALADADALIESLEGLIAKKRAIKQGVMNELLSGHRRLPGFGSKWAVGKIGDVLSIQHGKSQSAVVTSDGPYPILATGGQIGSANAFLWDKPSVLIGRKGTIDRPQYADNPFWTVDTLFYSAMNGNNIAKFFYYAFCLIDWYSHNEASGVPSLNARTIENIDIMIPHPDEQKAIVSVLDDIQNDLANVEAQLTKARQIRQGMMQDLLTGKVRLA